MEQQQAFCSLCAGRSKTRHLIPSPPPPVQGKGHVAKPTSLLYDWLESALAGGAGRVRTEQGTSAGGRNNATATTGAATAEGGGGCSGTAATAAIMAPGVYIEAWLRITRREGVAQQETVGVKRSRSEEELKPVKIR